MSSTEKKSLGEDIYSGAASFGRAWAFIGAIIGTIIGIGLFIGGIYLATRKVSIETVQAIITSVNCRPIQNNNQMCNIGIEYTFKNEKKNTNIDYNGNRMFSVNQKIDVYINLDKPSEITIDSPASKTAGIIMIIVGIIIIGLAWLWYWLTKRYKFLGAAQGVGGAIDIIRF